MLWIPLLVGIVVGVFAGGRSAFRLACHMEYDAARRKLFFSGLWASVCGMMAASLTLGWPWKPVSVSAVEEVTRTVTKTVEVPVRVTRWIFFRGEEKRKVDIKEEVTEKIAREKEVQQFSVLLLVPLALVGLTCFLLERWIVSLMWRWRGSFSNS